MYCSSCGAQNADDAKFCSNCGTDFAPNSIAVPEEETLKLGWAKFLGYFALWFSAVLNIGSAITYLTGIVYDLQGSSSELIYGLCPALKITDILYGLLLAALGVLCIMSAIAIIKKKRSVIKLVVIVGAMAAIISIVYAAAVTVIVQTPAFDSSSVASIIVGIVMIFVNYKYFKNRESIFCN